MRNTAWNLHVTDSGNNKNNAANEPVELPVSHAAQAKNARRVIKPFGATSFSSWEVFF